MKYPKKRFVKRITKTTNIKNRISIHERPKEVDGTRFEDWIMDLTADTPSHAILTQTGRNSNLLPMGNLKTWQEIHGCSQDRKKSDDSECREQLLQIMEVNLRHMNGYQVNLAYPSILRMPTPHGKRELLKTQQTHQAIYPQGIDISNISDKRTLRYMQK